MQPSTIVLAVPKRGCLEARADRLLLSGTLYTLAFSPRASVSHHSLRQPQPFVTPSLQTESHNALDHYRSFPSGSCPKK